MRLIGPSRDFVLLVRKEGAITADGQAITWEESTEFKGVITASKRLVSGQNYYHGKVGVEIDYILWTELTTITEKDRILLKGTNRIFDVIFVNNLFNKNKLARIDLHERKVGG